MDVGLLRRMSRLSSSAFAMEDSLFSEFKGAFAENYALQAVAPGLDAAPRYWINDKPRHEVNLLVQVENGIVPIEVKAGTSVDSPSLRYYARQHGEPTPLRMRLSARNLSLDGDLLNIPLYLAHRACDLIELALARGEWPDVRLDAQIASSVASLSTPLPARLLCSGYAPAPARARGPLMSRPRQDVET